MIIYIYVETAADNDIAAEKTETTYTYYSLNTQ